MTEETQTQTESQETPSAVTQSTEHMIPKSRFDEVNNRLKELQRQTEEATKAQREKETQALAEQNQYKTLYEQLLAEFEPAKAKAAKADAYESAIQARNQARIAQIPKEKQAAVPPIDDPVKMEQWLDNALPLLLETPKPKAPSLDGGSGNGASRDASVLSQAQQTALQMAQAMGYSVKPENVAQYAKTPIKPSKTSNEE